MPQMSSMDWLFLNFYFLILYFFILILIYFLNFNNLILDKQVYNKKEFFLFSLKWY